MKVSVAGMSNKHPGKKLVNIGNTLSLVWDKNNVADENAIAVYFGAEQVGYISTKKTVADGCLSAEDVVKTIPLENIERYKLVVEEIVTLKFSKRESKGFKCSLLPIEGSIQMNAIVDSSSLKKIQTNIAGSVSTYGGRKNLIERFKQGDKIEVELRLTKGENSEEKLLAYFEENPVGHIKKEGNEDLYVLLPKDGTSIKGQIKGLDRLQLKLEVDFTEEEFSNNSKTGQLEHLMDEIVSKGICSLDKMHEVRDYLMQNGVSVVQMISVFSSYKEYPDEIALKIPSNPKVKYVDNTGILKRTVAYVNINKNLMFEGERGCGKNVLAETLAWVYQRPFYEFSLNSGQDNSTLLGSKTFVEAADESKEESVGLFKKISKQVQKGSLLNWFKGNNEADAEDVIGIIQKLSGYVSGSKKLKFEPDAIIQAAEYGGIIVLDEFNTSYGHMMSIFNSLLDSRRRIHVPGYKTVEADPNFIAIATQNRDYQSTFDTNEATVDRFVPIIFPSLPSIIEVISTNIEGISAIHLGKCNDLFLGMSKCIRDGEMDEKSMTIRGFIDACAATFQDISLKDALIDNVANRAQDLDDRKTITNMIEDMF